MHIQNVYSPRMKKNQEPSRFAQLIAAVSAFLKIGPVVIGPSCAKIKTGK